MKHCSFNMFFITSRKVIAIVLSTLLEQVLKNLRHVCNIVLTRLKVFQRHSGVKQSVYTHTLKKRSLMNPADVVPEVLVKPTIIIKSILQCARLFNEYVF